MKSDTALIAGGCLAMTLYAAAIVGFWGLVIAALIKFVF